MKVSFSKRWSTVLLLFWGLQTFALPVPTHSSARGDALKEHGGTLDASLLSRNSFNLALERPRRKVADMDVSSGPVEYMKQLRSSLTNENGSPTLEREDDPTNVWGLVDRGKSWIQSLYVRNMIHAHTCLGWLAALASCPATML